MVNLIIHRSFQRLPSPGRAPPLCAALGTGRSRTFRKSCSGIKPSTRRRRDVFAVTMLPVNGIYLAVNG
jgi:hypothetical protein